MGLMRLLLAAAVFIGHEGPILGMKLIEGGLAVQAFFLISGFYMALILETKYINATKLFLINRFTKIYFMYFVVLSGCLIAMATFGNTFYISNHQFFSFYSNAPLQTSISYAFSNLAILGLDALMFFNIQPDGSLCFILSCSKGTGAHFLMLIPQAWSLSSELIFYALAPLLIRNSTGKLIALTTTVLAIRFYFWQNYSFMDIDPWSGRFFPFEISTFLLGMLAYRFYSHPRFEYFRRFSAFVALVPFIGVVGYEHLFLPLENDKILFVFCFWISLPFLFSFSRTFTWDRLIGELSYPIYLSHLLVVQIVRNTGLVEPTSHSKVFMFVLLFSGTLLWLERPIERWRQKNLVKNEALEKHLTHPRSKKSNKKSKSRKIN